MLPQQFINRQPGPLARNIPKRYVDGADGIEEWPCLAHPVHVSIQLSPDIVNPADILADQHAAHILAGMKYQGTAGPVGGLANPCDPLIRVDFEECPVVFDAFDQPV